MTRTTREAPALSPEPLPGSNRRLQRSGYACLYADEARALTRLDALARDAIAAPDVEEWQVASLIDEEDLVKCGYIHAFPGQLTAAAAVDADAYERVARTGALATSDLCYRQKHLAPAACLNIYPMLGARRPHRNAAVTTLATVFRHEQRFDGLLRLWEFKVREFVFVGERPFVLDMLERAAGAASDLGRRLRLTTRVVNASDHFYPTRENVVRQKMQLQASMKRELVAPVRDSELSLASFNFHGTHFSGPYGFDRDETVTTGCVGFGLHRWLAACADDAESERPPMSEIATISKGANQ